MRYEEEPNLTLFFRRFLNTSEGMDADLGFSIYSHRSAWGLGGVNPK